MKVNTHDAEDHYDSPITPTSPQNIPSSPPPSFRSRTSSITSRRVLSQDPLGHDVNQDLADTFDDGEDSDAENDGDDRQRLMRADPRPMSGANTPPQNAPAVAPRIERRVTELPSFTTSRSVNRPTNDGVFANLSAKLERGEQSEEKPPVSQFPHQASHILMYTDLRTSSRRCHTPVLGNNSSRSRNVYR
jgi:hypothetical protein